MSLGAGNIIELRDVTCVRDDAGVRSAVRGASLVIGPSSVNVLCGCSGCGKNLLLRIIGLMERPDSGGIWFCGENVAHMSDENRFRLRNEAFGYVFNPPFIIQEFSPFENIAAPLFKHNDISAIKAKDRTEEVLEFTGLAQLPFTVTADKLSAGLQLRLAVARALANQPTVLIVEEPDRTVSGRELDSFMTLLRATAEKYTCSVVVTMAVEAAILPGERRIECAAGRIVCDATL